jgi:hypothetical protein
MAENEYDDSNDNDIPGLRKQARRASQLERELEQARRELAFAKVPGLNTSDPKVGYFVKGYEGEFTPDAIRAAAVSAGFIAEEPQTQQVQQSLEGQQAIQQVVQGAPTVGGLTPEAQMEEAFRTGGTEAMLEVARQYVPVAGMSE